MSNIAIHLHDDDVARTHQAQVQVPGCVNVQGLGRASIMASAYCSTAALLVSASLSRCTITCSTPHSRPCAAP